MTKSKKGGEGAKQAPVAEKAKAPSASGPRVSAPAMAPVSMSNIVRNQEPRVTRSGRSMVVEHQELLLNVANYNTADSWLMFQWLTGVYALQLTPGNILLCPWLANLAKEWDEFVFEMLEFIYVPRCPSSTAGAIQMAISYDAHEQDPANEQAFLSFASSVDASVWQPVTLRASPAALKAIGPKRYNTFGVLSTGTTTTSAGVLYLAITDNSTANLKLGKLFVRYRVRLTEPQPVPGGLLAPLYNQLLSQSVNLSPTTPFAGAVMIGGPEANTLGIVTDGAGTMYFPIPGRYRAYWSLIVTGGSSANPTFTPGTGADVAGVVTGGNQGVTAGTGISGQAIITITQDDASVFFDFSPCSSTVTQMNMSICPIPQSAVE